MTKTQLTKKHWLLVFLAGFYCVSLVVSNILAAKTWSFFGLTFTAGLLIFPFVYIVNDVLVEIYGYKNMKKIIWLGFGLNLLVALLFVAAIALPEGAHYKGQEAFAQTLGQVPRILFASLMSYLAGSFINARIMDRLKKWREDKLMFRCVTSTVVAEFIDMAIFATIAFAFSLPWQAIGIMIVSQGLVKSAYEVVIYPVTRKCILWARTLD